MVGLDWDWGLADVFRGLLVEGRWRGPLPRIHCYCFAKSHETDDDVIKVRWERVVIRAS